MKRMNEFKHTAQKLVTLMTSNSKIDAKNACIELIKAELEAAYRQGLGAVGTQQLPEVMSAPKTFSNNSCPTREELEALLLRFCIEVQSCALTPCEAGTHEQAARDVRSALLSAFDTIKRCACNEAQANCKDLSVKVKSQVLFYEPEYYMFSNFSAFSIFWRGFLFPTVEHAYQWMKYEGQIDDRGAGAAAAIRCARSPYRASLVGARCKSLRREDWDKVKVGIMEELLREKIRQHSYVKKKLIETGDRELIENSPVDDFWGSGPSQTGQNMLGKLWMKIRQELINAK